VADALGGRRSNLRGAVWGKLRNRFRYLFPVLVKGQGLGPQRDTDNKPLEAQLGFPYVQRALQRIDGIQL